MASSSDQKKWDDRYTKHPRVQPIAAPVLAENAHLLPSAGDALDLACGLGGNAQLLASHRLSTSAWDISQVALKQLKEDSERLDLAINVEVRDVVERPPAAESFDIIVVSRFLDRQLFSPLSLALRPGGLLFYQTFTQQNTGAKGPSNPEFLLAPNELLRAFSGLRVLSFRDEGVQGDLHQGLRNESWIIVQKEEE